MIRSSKVGRTWQVEEFIGRRCCPSSPRGPTPGVRHSGPSAYGNSFREQLRRLNILVPACGGCDVSRRLHETPPVPHRDCCCAQPLWNRLMRQSEGKKRQLKCRTDFSLLNIVVNAWVNIHRFLFTMLAQRWRQQTRRDSSESLFNIWFTFCVKSAGRSKLIQRGLKVGFQRCESDVISSGRRPTAADHSKTRCTPIQETYWRDRSWQMRRAVRLPRGRRGEENVSVFGAPPAEATQDVPESKMRPLSEPRSCFLLERPQTLLPLEGLPLRLLPAGGGAAARHGRAGRAQATASGGVEESAEPSQRERPNPEPNPGRQQLRQQRGDYCLSKAIKKAEERNIS